MVLGLLVREILGEGGAGRGRRGMRAGLVAEGRIGFMGSPVGDSG